MKQKTHILTIIVLAQFMCTSLWFAGNAVMPDLIVKLDLQSTDLGYITSSVQFGFIIGTLVYAAFTIADRFHPSNVFLISAMLGAIANLLIVLDVSFSQILIFRFLTGFFLAGIYPVGMKIAADYFEKGLGKALSFLVGALVLGTALPHLIASIEVSYDWRLVLIITSVLAVLGGLLIKLFVGEGPFRSKLQVPKFRSIGLVFKNKEFRAASFGYFGHMWELYAFWAFVPIILAQYSAYHLTAVNISLFSFFIIGLGGMACVFGGYLSEYWGSKKVATWALGLSGMFCLLSPFMFQIPLPFFIVFLIFWGLVVIADSPLFSSLVAKNAKTELKGTALTIVTCIGFAITIVSIQLISFLVELVSFKYVYLILVIGPGLGVFALFKK
ncbi:MFS transporter [Ekhidna sp. MALMAid0563]|uniref:MFS transporter n=1 Tax=Ekhidna sp. MALMAid0563 TaxID=3143937 RepID=UPI0032DF0C4E